MTTLREFVLAGSTLPTGATIREHLLNQKTCEGGGEDVIIGVNFVGIGNHKSVFENKVTKSSMKTKVGAKNKISAKQAKSTMKTKVKPIHTFR